MLMVKIIFSIQLKNQIVILTIYFIRCLGVTSSVPQKYDKLNYIRSENLPENAIKSQELDMSIK